ncbi:MAG TPA: hypothetical protein VFQ45_14725 [Longimicrobium sp.]|nr:hypothetical protein [Longimicrobium sp.]
MDDFDALLGALQPLLARYGLEQVEDDAWTGRPFGSRYATFAAGDRQVRIVYEGRDRWFVIEALQPRSAGSPAWTDLAEPLGVGDEARIARIAEVFGDALRRYLNDR